MRLRTAAVVTAMLATAGLAAGPAQAGRQSPSLRFFSSGGGAHADWVHGDDGQEIRVVATTTGFAGIDVKHAEGLPTASYPNSSFDFRSSQPGPSLGYPRLVYIFSDGGNASLRPLTWTTTWQTVSDNNWDNNAGGCGFLFQVTWQQIQACHPGTIVTEIFFTTDPGMDVEFRVDNLTTAGERFTHARDNDND